ncbi:MAG: MBL fold metallo-hydrolase [Anaerolineae bacterium]
MEIVEVRPGTWACLMDNETANAGFVVTQKGVIIIDTLDTPARGRELAAAITARTDRPVRFIVNTHHHYDHTFGNQVFDAAVIAHCRLADELAQAVSRDLAPVAIAARLSTHPEDVWLVEELEVTYPNIVFQDRLVLDMPPKRLILQHLGGHTPDSIVIDLPEEGVLFAGDLVFEGRVPFLRQAHVEEILQALREVERRGARTIVPGYGALCDTAYVVRVRDYIEALRDTVADLVSRGWSRTEVLTAKHLPRWWTEDRPELQRANVARVYDQVAGSAGG